MAKIRIINFIEDARYAGPQNRIVLISEALRSERVTTYVVAPLQDSEKLQEVCENKGIPLRQLPIHRPASHLSGLVVYLLSYIPELLLLVSTFRRLKPDLVHVSGGAWQTKGVLAATLSGLDVIWHLNDTHTPSVVHWAFKLLSRLPSGFIFASEATHSYYSEMISGGGQPAAVIQSAVDLSKYSVIPRRSSRGRELVFGTVASISPVKNFEQLLTACELLLDVGAFDFRVVIAGPVPDSQRRYFDQIMNNTSAGLRDRLTLLGQADDVPAVLSSFDVFLCTSKFEASPTAVWEAMASGLPIIANEVGDIPLFMDARCGFLIGVDDAVGTADAMTRLALDGNLRGELGANCREMSQRFSASSISRQTCDFYLTVKNER